MVSRPFFTSPPPSFPIELDPYQVSDQPALDSDSQQSAQETSNLPTGHHGGWFSRSAALRPRSPSHDGALEEVVWGIHWRTPVSIASLFILAIATASTHHLYYRLLHGTAAGDVARQQWVSRIGTGLAFLFQSAAVCVTQVSRRQLVWMTLRQQFIPLSAIDALFSVTSDLSQFTNIGMIKRAWVATVMAAALWLIPLTIIFTPGTISVEPGGIHVSSGICEAYTVKYLFDPDSAAVRVQPVATYSLANRENNLYNGPSDYAIATFSTIAYGWGSFNEVAAIEGCPINATCYYNTTVTVPRMACSLQDENVWEPLVGPWEMPDNWTTIFDHIPDGMVPMFLAKQDDTNPNNVWIEHTEFNLPSNDRLRQSLFLCRNSIAQYNVFTSFINLHLNISDTSDAAYHHVAFIEDELRQEPPESPTYDDARSFFDTICNLLEGSILLNISAESTVVNRTKIGSMTYGGVDTMTTKNLTDILSWSTFSMAMMPMFSTQCDMSAFINETCLIGESFNIYTYDHRKLLITYAAATVVSIIMALIGIRALASNGVDSNHEFSTILLTTRNPTLDAVAVGACMGGGPLPEKLEKLEMRFGVISSWVNGIQVERTAMGVRGEVTEIKKGGRYS